VAAHRSLLWLLPPVHFRAMIVVRLNGSKFEPVGDGLLFWFLILDPRPRPPARLSYPVRLILVMAIHVLQIMAGALLALAPQDLYPFYSLCGRLYPTLGPRFDEALGGFVVYFPGCNDERNRRAHSVSVALER
jgi:putative membrane protein